MLKDLRYLIIGLHVRALLPSLLLPILPVLVRTF